MSQRYLLFNDVLIIYINYSPAYERFLNNRDVLRARDMTRNHITSTEIEGRFCASTPQLYRYTIFHSSER